MSSIIDEIRNRQSQPPVSERADILVSTNVDSVSQPQVSQLDVLKDLLATYPTIFERAARLYPDTARIWQERLKQVTPTQIQEIFNRIPDGRITPIAAKFAIDLLTYNRERISFAVAERLL